MSEQQGDNFREVLYTIDHRGKRRWVYPTLAEGIWLKRRMVVAYILMAIYLLMPWIEIGGKQGVLLDFAARKFIFFGTTFWATDTFFVVLVLGALAIALFFFTALFGRIWCGWACPETVFLEFLFRPIERFVEGSAAARKRLDDLPWTSPLKIRKKLLKHSLCALFAWVLASTALAYFIGREPLIQMMSDWPSANPVPFAVTLIAMGLMAFQFGWFREQFCTVLCPYARFQSVMMDSDSLVVGYNPLRGEPRGKRKKGAEDTSLGDCVDCGLCVRVCPTGIDIRNGLQLECIACTQCIDACDSIMEKVGKPKGLIKYDTENRLHGKKSKIIRPRVFIYATIIVGYAFLFTYSLLHRSLSDVQILRGAGDSPYSTLADGRISNHLRVRLSNKGDDNTVYHLSVVHPAEIELLTPVQPFPVPAGEIGTAQIFLNFPAEALGEDGKRLVEVQVQDDRGFSVVREVTILGPGK